MCYEVCATPNLTPPPLSSTLQIANPKFVNATDLYHVCKPCSHAGFELWQVRCWGVVRACVKAHRGGIPLVSPPAPPHPPAGQGGHRV